MLVKELPHRIHRSALEVDSGTQKVDKTNTTQQSSAGPICVQGSRLRL